MLKCSKRDKIKRRHKKDFPSKLDTIRTNQMLLFSQKHNDSCCDMKIHENTYIHTNKRIQGKVVRKREKKIFEQEEE